MHVYRQIYEFAASSGALEGYVYHKKNQAEIDMKALTIWIDNLLAAYTQFPDGILREFQDSCDLTIGRAMCSLVTVLGKGNALIGKLKNMIKGEIPNSADDFQKKKWFQEKSE